MEAYAEICPKCEATKPVGFECPWCAIKRLEKDCERLVEENRRLMNHRAMVESILTTVDRLVRLRYIPNGTWDTGRTEWERAKREAVIGLINQIPWR